MPLMERRFPVGAELLGSGRVAIRVWASAHETVHVELDGVRTRLDAAGRGYFEGVVPGAAGSRYGFVLGDDKRVLPDPASRWQPDGPHGLSEIVDPSSFAWSDAAWPGVSLPGQVLYELHVGTFTREGTWRAAAAQLPRLAELGVTVVQMMPVAEFAGAFGWGYDAVQWFAPSHLYGRPDDLRFFVDEAHRHRLGVVLDVVYNHLGPDGNYLPTFSRDYISTRYENEWGEPLNFDGPTAAPVRELVLSNVEYWITEFHVDGLRLDATQQIYDRSPEHLIAAIAARARACTRRSVIVTGENEPQVSRLLRAGDAGGYGLDALYNDDFHHAARVALTGIREAYYMNYDGSSRELLAAARWGFLFQGQWYVWQRKRRGTPALDLAPSMFVAFLENHDQVANSAAGQRLVDLAHPGDFRALTALLLLMPSTPMLFQGQELGSTAPWAYFADHHGTLGAQVQKGRLQFLTQFPRLARLHAGGMRPDATSRDTFEACRLIHTRDARAERLWRLHRDLLALRREDPVFRAQRRPEGSCVGEQRLLLRFGDLTARSARVLLVNLGKDVDVTGLSEPLLAPPPAARWKMIWSSERHEYGGAGLLPWDDSHGVLPAHAAIVLGAEDEDPRGE